MKRSVELFWKFFYLVLIFGYIGLVALFAAIFGAPFLEVSHWYAVFSVLMFSFIIGLSNLVVAVILRLFPLKLYGPPISYFYPKKNERVFWRKTGIKRWKIIVPDLLNILKIFDKTTIKDTSDPDYLLRFLREMGWAEMMHTIGFFVGYAVLFIPMWWVFTGDLSLNSITRESIEWSIRHNLIFVLPLAVMNSFINFLSIAVQRYNRPVILKLYEKALRKRNGDNRAANEEADEQKNN